MKVERLIAQLQRFNGDAEVRFHTSGQQDLDVLSIYSKTAPNNPTLPVPRTKFVEIDLGSKE